MTETIYRLQGRNSPISGLSETQQSNSFMSGCDNATFGGEKASFIDFDEDFEFIRNNLTIA